MATLKELQDLHEEMLTLCGNYAAMMFALDGGEPEEQKKLIADYVQLAQENMLKAATVVAHLMVLKIQDGEVE